MQKLKKKANLYFIFYFLKVSAGGWGEARQNITHNKNTIFFSKKKKFSITDLEITFLLVFLIFTKTFTYVYI